MGATLLRRPYSPPSLLGGVGTRTPAGILIPSGFATDDAFSPLDLSTSFDLLVCDLSTKWTDENRNVQQTTDGGAVGGVTDSSPSNTSIIQATVGARPTLQTGEVSGKDSLEYDGGDYLVTNLSAASKGVTLIAVVKPTNFTGNRTFFGASLDEALIFAVLEDGTISLGKQGITSIGTSTGVITAGQTAVVAATYGAAGEFAFWINGVKDASTGTNDQAFAARVFHLGMAVTNVQPYLGQYPLAAHAPTVLSDGVIQAYCLNLKTYYGIT